jgi:hypothetical protein
MTLSGRIVFRSLPYALTTVALLTVASCALTATRPVQEMSDTGAAIRAAKEVQADTLAPELYRQANEWFLKARKEYKFKNFSFAQQYAVRARKFAEQAEYESIKNGGTRSEAPADQPAAAAPAPAPNEYPAPQGTPAESYEQRKAEDEAARKAAEQASRPSPAPSENPAVLAPPPIVINTPGAPPVRTGP